MASDTAGKVKPHSRQAETAVLGAVFLDNAIFDIIAPVISPLDFYIPAHRTIYEAMQSCNQKQTPIDLTTMENELVTHGDMLKNIGGLEYLVELTSQVPTTANAEHYAHIVRMKSRMRAVIEASAEITSAGYELPDEIEENQYFDWAGGKIYAATQEERVASFSEIGEEVTNFFTKWDRITRNPDRRSGIPSGFTDLDSLTGGFSSGDLIILGARPSMGKTSFALNIAENVAAQNIPTLVFSLEMNTEQLTTRLLASVSKVDMQRLRAILQTGKIMGSDHTMMGMLQKGASIIYKYPMLLDDTPGISIQTLRARCRQWKSNRKYFPAGYEGGGLVVIDYLQLMHGNNTKGGNREQEVSDISRGLKALAREIGVPILVLAQLNRKVEETEDKKPRLSHLRESGSIEQDADIILFLHRPEYYKRDDESLKGQAELILAKHRNGPTGSVELIFKHKYTRFENKAQYEQDEWGPPQDSPDF
ncbi:MAG: replicative DNA helicase [Deltaproteobacteria bacterium]|nr:replicative DNA helicase [Deltaproteobacteria bacterium]